MCGIAGLFQLAGQAGEREIEIVTRMTDALQHRGPDAWGLSRQGPAVLGHRRLSIIDLSPAGNQPMSDRSGDIWITYNGEIYNSPELRRKLKDKDHSFRSASDTEVLLEGYLEWGIEGLLERSRGMFAFGLLDCRNPTAKLFLARDRLGIKPLYYWQSEDGYVLFSSELRGLLASGSVPRKADRRAFLQYLQWGSIPDPYTAIEGACSLLPGTYLKLEDQINKPKPYWDLAESFKPAEDVPTREDALHELRSLLQDTVKIHHLSDVPVGLFLSGGVDSASLALLTATRKEDPLRTISVTFDEAEFNEGAVAAQIAGIVQSQHTEVRVSSHDFVMQLGDVLGSFDQPTIDGVNTYYVSWAARRCGLKVVLSGTGGDELFLGYKQFHASRWGAKLCSLLSLLPVPLRTLALRTLQTGGNLAGMRGVDRLGYLKDPGPEAFYRLYRGLFTPSEIRQLAEADAEEMASLLSLPPSPADLDFLRRLEVGEFSGYLRNQLLRDTDVMGMAHSLEVRVPFLDHVLIEKVASWPDAYKFRAGINKAMLVDAMLPDLPREVWDRPKQGFVFPLDRWIRRHAKSFLEEARGCDSFQGAAVKEVWDRFLAGQVHWSRPWATLVWARWQESIH